MDVTLLAEAARMLKPAPDVWEIARKASFLAGQTFSGKAVQEVLPKIRDALEAEGYCIVAVNKEYDPKKPPADIPGAMRCVSGTGGPHVRLVFVRGIDSVLYQARERLNLMSAEGKKVAAENRITVNWKAGRLTTPTAVTMLLQPAKEMLARLEDAKTTRRLLSGGKGLPRLAPPQKPRP